MTFNLRRGGAAAGMAAGVLAVLAFAARPALADTIYPNSPNPFGSEFTNSSEGWFDVAHSCSLLGLLPDAGCRTELGHSETVGNPPGALRADFTALANLLGILYTGTETYQSPSFTIGHTPTGPSTFSYERQMIVQAGLDITSQAKTTVTLVDESVNPASSTAIGTVDTYGPEAAFKRIDVAGIPASVLQLNHRYHLVMSSSVTTTFLQLAQGTVHTYQDNIKLQVRDDTPGFVLAPSAATLPATDIAADGATLNSTVTPNGNATGVHYDFGTDTNYGRVFPSADVQIGRSLDPVTPNAVRASGLAQCTTYHFRVVATNTKGATVGGDQSFRTFCRPDAATLDATSISATTAILNGIVTPNGPATTYHYDFGVSTAYGAATPDRTAGSGFNPFQPLSEPVAGLTPLTTYHFRITAQNVLGALSANDVAFTTPPLTGPSGATGASGTSGAAGTPGTPGAAGKPGAPAVSGSSTNTTLKNGDVRGLLRIRANLVKVGTAGRRRAQVRLPIFCTKKTGRTCAGTVKIRTVGQINPSAIKNKAKRRVTFLTFEYQLAEGKKGYAISNMDVEKLNLIEKIKTVPVTISVQVTDAGGNRQTIVQRGRLLAVRSP